MGSAIITSVTLVVFSVCLSTSARAEFYAWGDNTHGLTNPPVFATNVVGLATGDYHAIALLADGSVVAWGEFNSALQRTSPAQVPSDAMPAVAIGGAEVNGYSILQDGSLKIWGSETFFYGGPTNIPPQATNIIAVTAGPAGGYGLVLRDDGNVVTWGNYQSGGKLQNVPSEARHIVAVAAASENALALRSDGRVIAWGADSSVTNIPTSATNIVAIAAGYRHCAALRLDGRVITWGSLPFQYSGSIMPPIGATNITGIACGAFNIMALRRDGRVVAWGNDSAGQSSLPAMATNLTAVAGGGLSSFAVAGTGAPVFFELSISRTVASSRPAFLRLVASGQYPINYQWSFMGTNLPNATNSFLAITNTTLAHSGFYTLTASNAFGTATRTNLQLNVEPVIIYSQPVSQPMYIGGTVTLSASVFGAALTYQWQLNGTNLDGATNAALVLSNIQMTNAGAYTLAVSNAAGSATTAPAIVTVAPMLLTSQPTNIVWFPGGVTSFAVTVQSATALSYQWRRDGSYLVNATNSSVILSNLQASDVGTYDVVVSNALATTNSNSAVLSLVPIAAWGRNVAAIPASATNVFEIKANRGGAEAALTGGGRIIYLGDSGWMSNGLPSEVLDIVDFSMAGFSTIGLRSNGQVVAWGYGFYGLTNVPPGISNAIAVAAGEYHFLVLRSDGTVVAWGDNVYGQTNVPPWLTNVIGIASYDAHSLALTADGKVASWGRNSDGQTNVPISLSNVVAIAAGDSSSAALKDDGSLVAWGSSYGNPQLLPVSATNLVMITSEMPMLALRADGVAFVWGNISTIEQFRPPIGLANVSAIAVGGSATYLALVGEPTGRISPPFAEPKLDQSGFSVVIPTQSGRVYRLEFKSSLSASNWTALPLVAGTGKLRTLTDPSATNSAQRFYRVRQW